MPVWRLPAGCLGAAMLLAACTSAQQRVENKEDLLITAGFTVRPADTQQRQAMLGRLPPNLFFQKRRDGEVFYIYADPLVCNCLYVGDAAAYARYREKMLLRRSATEQQIAARESEEADWNWGDYDHGHP